MKLKPLRKLSLTFEKEKSSDAIVGAILFTTLYISLELVPRYFFGVLSQNCLSEAVLGNYLNDHNILSVVWVLGGTRPKTIK